MEEVEGQNRTSCGAQLLPLASSFSKRHLANPVRINRLRIFMVVGIATLTAAHASTRAEAAALRSTEEVYGRMTTAKDWREHLLSVG